METVIPIAQDPIPIIIAGREFSINRLGLRARNAWLTKLAAVNETTGILKVVGLIQVVSDLHSLPNRNAEQETEMVNLTMEISSLVQTNLEDIAKFGFEYAGWDQATCDWIDEYVQSEGDYLQLFLTCYLCAGGHHEIAATFSALKEG